MTHGSWWQATNLAGIMRVLDEIRKAGPRPAQIASTKHEDMLMHTTVVFASPHAVTTGYLRVFATHCQPGKSDDYVALMKKYFRAAVEEQIKKGVGTYWGTDEEHIPTRGSSMRYLVSTHPNAEALDRWAAVQSAVFEQAWQDGLASTTVPDSPRVFTSWRGSLTTRRNDPGGFLVCSQTSAKRRQFPAISMHSGCCFSRC
jgi:hypothetical protein